MASKGKGSRAGYQKRQLYSMSELLKMNEYPSDRSSLVSIYRTLAKAADQRIVRLKAYRHDKDMKRVLEYAYARAMRDIESWSGPGAERFNTKPPESLAQLEAKIEDIKTFLLAPTSTKKGIIEIYKKRADTINRKYGTQFKWDEVTDFFDSKLAELLDKKKASKTVLRTVAGIQRNKKEIIEGIKESKEINLKVPNSMEEKLIREAIENYGDEILAVFDKK